MAYRRLETRGEIRGGRFVTGFSGEQFALPEAVESLRRARRSQSERSCVCISGADPLNLAGLLLPGGKISALTGNRILFEDGLPVAALVAGDLQYFKYEDPARTALWRDAVLRRPWGDLRCTDIPSE